ncbi:hypothetical protein EP7_004849 [Isosphaeraceae bacterium EP7]
MNASLTLKALTALACLSAPVLAQSPAGRGFRLGGNRAAAQAKAAAAAAQATPVAVDEAPAKKDPKLVPAGSVPSPLSLEDTPQPTISLPDEPVEPYLLTKDAGPFMVLAHTFRDPNAVKYAIALTKELRALGLPAYVLQLKDFPGRSNVHNVPPTAPKYINQPNITPPEKYRTYDEAAVMVGKCKSKDESEKLLHQVKKIKPACLNGIPTIFHWRDKSLSRASMTTNPYIPVQHLYSQKADPIIKQMNGGPHAIYQCPGQYSLLVADFSGRSTTDVNNKTFLSQSALKTSPLATAADDAERLAETLSKDPALRQTGYKPYVYHDRSSSKVFMGSFTDPVDPAAGQLREKLLRAAGDRTSTINKKEGDIMVAPSEKLTDLARIKG